MKIKYRLKPRKPPRYKQLLVFVPEEEKQLGLAWEVLWHLKNGEFRDKAGRNTAISTFLALTEELLEEYCPPYEGGRELDNRRRTKL